MPIILDGKALSKKIEAQLLERSRVLKEKHGFVPALATVLVGSDPASVTYVRMKKNACARAGLESMSVELPEETTTDELLGVIKELNENPSVCGILLQHPVPRHIDERACFDAIAPSKDVDGVNTWTFGRMSMGLEAYPSATPGGIMALLAEYGLSVSGKRAVVVGRSAILGKPAAMMLLAADATVTVCHRKTVDLPHIVREADVVVAAVGEPKLIQADWIKEGAVLIDAGYNSGNIGDIDLENAAPRSSAYTPVPGGCGPMTIATLMKNTLLSAERMLGVGSFNK